jgi:hypothetical protein
VWVPFCVRKTAPVCLHFFGISFTNETYLLSSLCYILTENISVSKDSQDSILGNDFFSSPVYSDRFCSPSSAYCRLSPDVYCPNRPQTLSCNTDIKNGDSSLRPLYVVLVRAHFYFYLKERKRTYLKRAAFWDVVPCIYCVNRRFGGTYRLHFQGRIICGRGTSVSRWLQPPWRWGDTFLRNADSHKIYTAPHPRRRNFIVTAVKTSILQYIWNP